jgi:hypothetical protein
LVIKISHCSLAAYCKLTVVAVIRPYKITAIALGTASAAYYFSRCEYPPPPTATEQNTITAQSNIDNVAFNFPVISITPYFCFKSFFAGTGRHFTQPVPFVFLMR